MVQSTLMDDMDTTVLAAYGDGRGYCGATCEDSFESEIVESPLLTNVFEDDDGPIARSERVTTDVCYLSSQSPYLSDRLDGAQIVRRKSDGSQASS